MRIAEIVTVGGESGMTLLVDHLRAHPEFTPLPVEELSIHSNPWRTKAAHAFVGEARHISLDQMQRIKLLTEFASVNPTEGKIGAVLEAGVRKRVYERFPPGR